MQRSILIALAALIGFAPNVHADSHPTTQPTTAADYHDQIAEMLSDYSSNYRDFSQQDEPSLAPNNPKIISEKQRLISVQNDLQRLTAEEIKQATIELKADTDAVLTAHANLRADTNRTDVSLDSLDKTVHALDEEHETMLLEKVAADARRDAIASAIDRHSRVAADRTLTDPIVTQLKKLVDLRTETVSRVDKMSKVAVASQIDLNAAQAQLAEANVKLAQRQQEVANGAGADTVSTLNEQLINLEIAQHERDAKLDFIARRLDTLARAITAAEELDHLSDQARNAQQQLDNAQADKKSVESQIHEFKKHESAIVPAP